MNRAMKEMQQGLELATEYEHVICVIRSYLQDLTRTKQLRLLPLPCRNIKLRDPQDLFSWWIELERLTSEYERTSKKPELLVECRDVFGAAWEKAVTLGYRMAPQNRARA